MKRLRRLAWACLMTPALMLHAQPAINSGAIGADDGLPLRNLQIEVRQLDEERSTRERVDAGMAARAQPGQSGLAIDLDMQAQQGRRSGATQQVMLVLNGRRATIRLGNMVPLRLLQSFQRQGRWIAVPGTVWLQAGTGFDATPRWNGGDTVELELAAMQSHTPTDPSASTSTTVVLPLGEWVTVAQSDQQRSGQQAGLSGRDRWSSQSSLDIQVRVNPR